MANNNTQDVELRIRATNYSKKTTTEVTDALKDLVKAEEAQIAAAKKGAASASDLEKGYAKIESAVKALLGQQSLIRLFQSQSGALDELKQKLDASRKAQADYAASLPAGERMTAAQTAAFNKLGREAAAVEKQIARMEGRITTTTTNLKQFGIDSTNAASKQADITAAVNTANAALTRQDATIAGLTTRQQRLQAVENARTARTQVQTNVDAQFDAAVKAASALALQAKAERELAAANAMRNVQRDADLEALFTREANKRTEAINRQAAAMRAAADAAARQVLAANTTARGTAPVQAAPTVTARLGDIANPAAGAIKTVQELETAIGALQARVAAINGPVADYRASLTAAEQAQRSLAQMGGLIDSYNRQIVAVRAARTEYVAARTAVNELIAQMRAGATGDDITTRLRAAQSTLERTATNLGNVTTMARATQGALQAAGIQTNNLSGAESQLVAQAQRAAGAMNNLTDAYRRNGAAANGAGSSIFRWFSGEGGRSTLSFTQRLRGEMIGLAAGFIGLQAAIGLAKKTIDVYNAQSAIMARLTIVSGGDARKAAEEFKYLEQQADRIGFVFTEVAPAYAKFSIAMKAAGFDTQQTRFAFENIAGAAIKARLSTEEMTGILKAFEQMASKGKIQAEELRGQLGDRLPGAFQIAAKAAGKTVEEYTKMMELGEVGSDQVLAIARELGKTYGVAQQGATTLLVAQARFENATNRFLTAVGEGGFVQAYQALLEKLTTFMNDGSAGKLAQTISDGFVVVIGVLSTVADNLDLITVAIKALLAVKLLVFLGQLPALLIAARVEMVALNAAFGASAFINAASVVNGITAAMGAAGLAGTAARLGPILGIVATGLAQIARLIPVVAAAYVGWEIGTAINNRIDAGVVKDVQALTSAAKRAFVESDKALDDLNKARGTKDEKAAQEQYDKAKTQAVKAIEAQNAAMKAAREKGVDISKINYSSEKDRTGGKGNSTEDPGDMNTDPKKVLKVKAELEKDQKKIDRQAQNERLKAVKGDLAARLDLIDQEYDAKRENVKETIKGEKEQAEAMALINKASASKQAVERAKYNNEQARKDKGAGDKRVELAAQVAESLRDMQAKLNKDLAEQKGTALPIEDQLKAAADTVDKSFKEIEDKIRKYAKLNPGAAKTDMAQVEALKQQAVAISNTNVMRQQANDLVEEYNKKQKIMQTNVAAIQTRVDAGQVSIIAGNAAINEQLAMFGPGVQDAGKAALDFATKFQNMLDPVRFAEIVASVGSGMAKTGTTAQIAANNVVTQQKLLNNLLAAEAREREQIELKRSLNIITSAQATDELNASAVKYSTSIIALTEQLQGFIDKARESNAMSAEELDGIEASAANITLKAGEAKNSLSELDTLMKDSILNNGATAFDQMGESLAKVINKQQSIGEGFRGMAQAAGQFFASFLRDIAQAIIKQQILNALTAFMGGGVPGASNIAPIPIAHAGGMVGTQTRKRNVDPAMFANAIRYHDGGLPGLKADEVPTILQKGEEVLTKNDARNAMNGGLSGGGGGVDAGTRIVLVDDRSRVPEAMAGNEGRKVIIDQIKANIPTIKSMLGMRSNQ